MLLYSFSQSWEVLPSNSTIQVLKLADQESRRLGHNFIGTEMLLMGILEEENNQAAKYLREQGLTIETLQQKIENLIGKGSGFVAIEIPFTPRVNRIFELAISLTRGKSPVLPEHLFKAILDFKDGLAYEILKDVVDLPQTRAFITKEINEVSRWRSKLGETDLGSSDEDSDVETLRQEVRDGFARIDDQLQKISGQLESLESAIKLEKWAASYQKNLEKLKADIQEIDRKFEK